MIQPLRSAHRVVFLLAALVLPALLVAGLRARRPSPLMAAVPLPAATPAGPSLTWKTRGGTAIISLVQPGAGGGGLEIELSPATAFRGPDLLLYWTARGLPVDDLAPADVLLGEVSGQPVRRFQLPPAVGPGQGSLLLFSLAHHEVIGTTALPSLPPGTP
jgi:hypothetical protein